MVRKKGFDWVMRVKLFSSSNYVIKSKRGGALPSFPLRTGINFVA